MNQLVYLGLTALAVYLFYSLDGGGFDAFATMALGWVIIISCHEAAKYVARRFHSPASPAVAQKEVDHVA